MIPTLKGLWTWLSTLDGGVLFSAAVCLCGALMVRWVQAWLDGAEVWRLRRLRGHDDFTALETEGNPEATALRDLGIAPHAYRLDPGPARGERPAAPHPAVAASDAAS